MEVNKAELHLIYKQIKADPDTWFQQAWAKDFDKDHANGSTVFPDRCGTAYCFAGHAVVRAGYKFAWSDDSYLSSCDMVIDKDGRYRSISTMAQEILGLEDFEADDLFAANNSLKNIRNIITELTGQDPED